MEHQRSRWDTAGATKTFTHPIDFSWLHSLDRSARLVQQLGFTNIEGVDTSPNLIERARRIHPHLRPGVLLCISDLLLQTDKRNLARYQQHADRFGNYGVLETVDGAVCRHHSIEWLHELPHDQFAVAASRGSDANPRDEDTAPASRDQSNLNATGQARPARRIRPAVILSARTELSRAKPLPRGRSTAQGAVPPTVGPQCHVVRASHDMAPSFGATI